MRNTAPATEPGRSRTRPPCVMDVPGEGLPPGVSKVGGDAEGWPKQCDAL